MTKSKHKQPPKNFFRYLLDEYILFRRDFVIETSASVEDCVTHFGELRYEKQGWWKPSRILSSFTEKLDSTQFKIAVEHRQKLAYAQSASAEGSIESDDGTTFITGTVVLSGLYYWIWITILGFMILTPLVVTDVIRREPILVVSHLTLYGAVLIYMWIRMYRDRNYLVRQIQQAIYNAEMEANLSKAKNEPITQPSDDSSEPQSHQSKM